MKDEKEVPNDRRALTVPSTASDGPVETDAERSARLRDPAAPAEMHEFLV